MAKKKRDDGGGESSWMNTYSDMVTLLLTFFIMLFSMSSVEEEKWQMLIMAFTNRGNETSQVVVTPIGNGHDMAANMGESPLPAQGENIDTSTQLPSDIDQLYEYLKAYVEENNMEGTVDLSKGEGVVYIRFQDNIFFNPDRFELKADSMDILNFLGDGLKSVEDQILLVNISGHTAAIPNYEDYPVNDWRLSSERAASVATFFEEEKAIDPTKVIAIGYGKSRPVADNETADGKQKNRRVDMMIVSNEGAVDGEQLLEQLLSGTFDASLYPKAGDLAGALVSPGTDGAASEAAPQEEPPAETAPAPEPPAEEAPEGGGEPPAGQGEPAPGPDFAGGQSSALPA